MALNSDVILALERWASEYNEEFGLRDAKLLAKNRMKRRSLKETLRKWLVREVGDNKQGWLNMRGYPLSEYARALLWIPHSYNPDGTFDLSINYAVAVELLGQKHTGKTRKVVDTLVKVQESRRMAGLSCICGQSHDIL